MSRKAWKFSPFLLIAHVLTWCLLWGDFSWGNLVNGLLLGIAISLIFPLPSLANEVAFRPHRVIILLVVFLWELVAASLQMVALVLRFGHHPRSVIVEVKQYARSDLFLTGNAALLTLVPGTVVVEVDRHSGTLYMHAFNVRTAADAERVRRGALRQELRLLQAFATRAEVDAVRQALAQAGDPHGPKNRVSKGGAS